MRRLNHAAALWAAAMVLPGPVVADDHRPPPDERGTTHTPPGAARARGGGPAVNTGRIAAMIDAAAAGSTVIIPPGRYTEHLRIEKPIRLAGGGGSPGGEPAVVIDGGGAGDIVEIAVEGVEISRITVRNTGTDLDKENCGIRVTAPRARIESCVLEDVLFGIDLRQAPGSVIRGNRIGGKKLDIARRGDGLRLWRSNDTIVEDNVIHDGRDAILWYSTGVTIRGNKSLRCRYGLHLMFSDHVMLEENELRGNSVGVYFMYSKELVLRNNRLIDNRGPSGYGLGLKETDLFRVEGNVFAGNRVGVYIDGSPFTQQRPGEFTGNTFGGNDIGIVFLPAVKGNLFTANNFIDNIDQVSLQGRGALTGNAFAAEERGNFWSDYTGYDGDGDGVGDYTHEPAELFQSLLDREPRLRVLLFSPAQQAIELIGRALPAARPEPKFVDEYPLMRPVIASDAAVPEPRRAALAVAGAALLGAAALGWAAASGVGVRSAGAGAGRKGGRR